MCGGINDELLHKRDSGGYRPVLMSTRISQTHPASFISKRARGASGELSSADILLHRASLPAR
jgi:hypothetical protein